MFHCVMAGGSMETAGSDHLSPTVIEEHQHQIVSVI